MKKFFLFFFLFIIHNYLFADKLEFFAEKLITDYKGIAANGSVVLCYGDYGIITYSTNNGDNWRQLSLGPEHSIKKIISFGKTFYGVTDKSLIKSFNDVFSWSIVKYDETPEIISMDIKNDKIYILTKENILTTNLQLEKPKLFASLNPDSTYSSIVTDDEFLYVIEGNDNILKFKLSDGSLEKKINIRDLNFAKKFWYLSNLKVIENEIYSIIEVERLVIMPVGTDKYNYNNILIKSTDKGATWIMVSDSLKGTSCYNKINGDIYFIASKPQSSRMKIDFKKIVTGSNSPVIINGLDGIEREIYFNNYEDEYKLSEIIKLTDNVWLAAGNNKLILKTVNAGENWQIVSFFKTFYVDNLETNNTVQNLNSDIVFVPYFRKSDKEIYFSGLLKTTDGGATWLPRKYNPELKMPSTPSQYIFNKDGKGVLLFLYSNKQLYSTDYGETFRSVTDTIPTKLFQLSDNIPLDLGDRFLFKYIDLKDNNVFSKLYITNFERIIDTVFVDSVTFKNLMLSEDSVIYSVGLYRSDYQPADVTYPYGYYKYRKYFVYKSEDKGKTWEKQSGELPIEMGIVPYQKGWLHYDLTRQAKYFNGKIIIPYRHYQGRPLFCIYDIKTKQADSVVLNNTYSNSRDVLFQFGNRLCYFSLDNKLNYSAENNLTSGWDSLDKENDYINDDVFIKVASGIDYVYYTTGKYSFASMFGGRGYTVNVVKLSNDNITSVEEDKFLIKNERPFEVKPYPIPSSQGWINFKISGLNIENINDIFIFDNLGNKLNSIDIEFYAIENGSYLLKWNYQNLPSGVYYIKIGSGSGKNVVPVIISR